jgi:hypothetical protein
MNSLLYGIHMAAFINKDSIRFRNKNCDSTKKGLGYGETRLLIM